MAHIYDHESLWDGHADAARSVVTHACGIAEQDFPRFESVVVLFAEFPALLTHAADLEVHGPAQVVAIVQLHT